MNISTALPNPALQAQRKALSKPVAKESNPQAEAPQPAPNPIAEFFQSIGDFIFGKKISDLPNDGEKAEIESSHPLAEGRRDMIFVGGAGTNFEKAQDESKYLAERLGRDVTLIHNATNIPRVEGGLLGDLTRGQSELEGGLQDMSQVVADWHNEGHNEAVDAVKEEIRARFDRGEKKVDLMGASQGNQIIARALRELAQEPEMSARMKDVNVVNMMGPVRQSDYPAEVNYTHVELPSDPVTQELGENVPPDKVGERNANYDARAWGLPWKMLDGGWPGHDPVAILGPALDHGPVSDDYLEKLGLKRSDLEDLQRLHLDRIATTFA